jgi:hypothetical protein
MVDTPIYDKLVAEFVEADRYHGLGFVPPETVALSTYDDTTTIPAVTDQEDPTEAAEEPSEAVEEKDEVDEPPSVLDEAPKTSMALAKLLERIRFIQTQQPENPVSEDNHVFPIKRHPKNEFDFFQTAQIFDKRAA